MRRRNSELRDIKKALKKIDCKIDELSQLVKSQIQSSSTKIVPNTLESLPQHLKDTALTIATMGKATAKQVSAKTGRSRAAESDHLNQLASRGYLRKERNGKQVNFLVFSLYTQCLKCGTRVPMTFSHCTKCGASLIVQERKQ